MRCFSLPSNDFVKNVRANIARTVALLLLPLFVAGGALLAQESGAKPADYAVVESVTSSAKEKPKATEVEDQKPIKDDAIAREKWFRERYGPVTVGYLDYASRLAEQEIQKWGAMIPGTPAHKVFKNAASATGISSTVKAGLPEKTWRNIGPLDGSSLQNGVRDSNVVDTGRPTVILPHPTSDKILYVGFSGGGLWRCRNADINSDADWVWEPMTDGLPNSGNLAVGAAAFKPEDPNTIYLGLGDWFFAQGRGFFISSDGGETWTRGGSVGNTTRTWEILALPGSVVLVAGNDGLYRSTNGGTSFVQVQSPPFSAGQTGPVWDILELGDGSLVLSAMLESDALREGIIAYSTNRGATWTRATMEGFPADDTFGRIAIAASGNTLYGLYQTKGPFPKALMKSTDGGRSWFYQEAEGLFSPSYESTFYIEDDGGQAGYNHLVAVDPDDSDVVFVGANFSVYRSTNGGGSFSQFTSWLGREFQYTHADMHAGVWSPRGRPGPKALYLATDGGLSIVRQPNINPIPTGPTSIFASNPAIIDHRRNRGLPTHLVYHIGSTNADVPPGSKNRVIIGTQDNGTLLRKDAQREFYDYVIGGDGFGCLFHPYNGNMALGSLYYTQIYRSNDGGQSFRGSKGISDSEDGPFHTRLVDTLADPTGDLVYTYTLERPYVSNDFGENWVPLAITGWPNPTRRIQGFGASPMKMGLVGAVGITWPDEPGQRGDYYDFIAISDDNGATWRTSQIYDASSVPVYGHLAEIAFDTADPNIVYATSVTYDANASHIWKSMNGGRSWASIDHSNGFPFGIPVHVVKVDPLDNKIVYAGTDMGLYRTADGGTSWSRFGFGLPLVAVRDIYIAPDGSFIRIGTYGRGVWEMEGVTNAYAPIFSVHPQNQTSSLGQPVTFGAVVKSIPAPAYQWQVSANNGLSWSNIPGATSRLYTGSFGASDNGKAFRVIARNALGSVASNAAILYSGVQVSVLPSQIGLIPGGTCTFTATVTGASKNTDVTWRVSGGSLAPATDGNGNQCDYIAPLVPGTYTITATSVEDSSRSGSAQIMVVVVGVNIDDPPKGLLTGETATFQASLAGLISGTVAWEASAGVINPSTGVYVAPSTPQMVTITVTCLEIPSVSASAQVKVSSPNFDGNASASPQLLGLANAFGSTDPADLLIYDLNNDGQIDDEDLILLFRAMGWIDA